MSDIINLKQETARPKDASPTAPPDMGDFSADRERDQIEWTAPEHPRFEFGAAWFLGAGTITVLLAIIAVFAKNYLFIVFLALAFGVVLMYSRREPRELRFRLDNQGLQIGSRLRSLNEFSSFWIFENAERSELSFETRQRLSPYMRVPLSNADPEAIRALLAGFLPEKEHPQFAIDIIARRMGL